MECKKSVEGRTKHLKVNSICLEYRTRWDRRGTEPAGQYTFFYRKRNENHELGTGLIVHKIII
jgi:hypothetical protein